MVTCGNIKFYDPVLGVCRNPEDIAVSHSSPNQFVTLPPPNNSPTLKLPEEGGWSAFKRRFVQNGDGVVDSFKAIDTTCQNSDYVPSQNNGRALAGGLCFISGSVAEGIYALPYFLFEHTPDTIWDLAFGQNSSFSHPDSISRAEAAADFIYILPSLISIGKGLKGLKGAKGRMRAPARETPPPSSPEATVLADVGGYGGGEAVVATPAIIPITISRPLVNGCAINGAVAVSSAVAAGGLPHNIATVPLRMSGVGEGNGPGGPGEKGGDTPPLTSKKGREIAKRGREHVREANAATLKPKIEGDLKTLSERVQAEIESMERDPGEAAVRYRLAKSPQKVNEALKQSGCKTLAEIEEKLFRFTLAGVLLTGSFYPTNVSAQSPMEEAELNSRIFNSIRDGNLSGVIDGVKRGANINAGDNLGRTFLMWAVIFSRSDIVQWLVRNGADINLVDGSGMNALVYADQQARISTSNREEAEAIFRFLHAATHRVEESVEQINKALLDAASKGDLRGVHAALERGANINFYDERGSNAMIRAAAGDHPHIIDYLIKNSRSDPNPKDEFGNNLLMIATKNGNIRTVRYLLDEKGGNLNAVNKFGNTALIIAAESGHDNIVEMLITRGAKLDTANNRGETALTVARYKYYPNHPVVRLLEKYAQPEERPTRPVERQPVERTVERAPLPQEEGDVNKQLLDAARNGDLNEVKRLLQRGADVNAQDQNGTSALMMAAGNLDIVKLLVSHGAYINANDNTGRTVLDEAKSQLMELAVGGSGRFAELSNADPATIRHQQKIVEFLEEYQKLVEWVEKGNLVAAREALAKGADVNARNDDGTTILMIAVAKGHKDIAKLLVSKGADVNAKKERVDKGMTALMYACLKGDFNTVSLLIIKKADVNAAADGLTPLMCAAGTGHKKIVELLIIKGADVNARLDDGRTALALAKENKHTQVVRLLKRHGAR